MAPRPIIAGIKDAWLLSKKLRLGMTAFELGYAKGRYFANTTSYQLQRPYNPLFDYLVRQWTQRKDPLWWSVVFKGSQNKSVVRSWAHRRIRQAFVESLKKKGYAADGTRLKNTKVAGKATGRSDLGGDLFGTAQLVALPKVLNIKFTELLRETDRAVEYIIHNHKKGNAGQEEGRQSKPYKTRARKRPETAYI